MLKFVFNTVKRSLQNTSTSVKILKNQFEDYKNTSKPNENPNAKPPDYIRMNPFYWGFKAKKNVISFLSKFSNNKLEYKPSNSDVQDYQNNITGIVSKTGQLLTNIINKAKDLILKTKVGEIIKIQIYGLPTVIKKLTQSLIKISINGKNYLVDLTKTATKALEKYKDKDLVNNYSNFAKNINNSIINYSSKFKLKSLDNNKSSFFNDFWNMINMGKKTKELESLFKSKGNWKYFYYYKTKLTSKLQSQSTKEILFNGLSYCKKLTSSIILKFTNRLGFKFLKIKLIALMLLTSFIGFKFFSWYLIKRKEKKNQKKLNDLYNLTEKLKQENSEIISKNESLKLLLELEKEKNKKLYDNVIN